MGINIINGVPINTTPVVPERFANILYAATMPVSIPLDTLVIYKQTLWRGSRTGEFSFVNPERPVPVKGFLEYSAMKISELEFYMTPFINDYGFDFQITNISPGVYILARMGNLAITPLTFDVNFSLFLSFYDTDGIAYSFSWKIITVGADTGKFQITVFKNEAAANTLSNAKFNLRLIADFYVDTIINL